MKPSVKAAFAQLENKFGRLNKIGNGQSLFEIPAIDAIVYFRYSKIFPVSKSVKKTSMDFAKSTLI